MGEKSKIWFTSDTHFGAERTLNMSKRPFKTVEEMDETIISNWNSVVGESDIVYHLGDFGDYKVAEKLNGKIVLVCGNYEMCETKKVIDNALLFDSIFAGSTSIDINYCREDFHINMSHEPSLIKKYDISNNQINLFGHIHKLCMVKRFGINVGMDCHNFYPIDMRTVLFYHNEILHYYDYEVFN